MADIIYRRGLSSAIENEVVPIIDGQVLVTTDTAEMFIDMPDGQRKKITDKEAASKAYVDETIANLNISGGGGTGNGIGQSTVEGGEIFNDYENNIAAAPFAHASGQGTKAVATAQVALGKYNVGKNNTIIEIGKGENDSNRKNALELTNNNSVILGEADATGKYSLAAGTNNTDLLSAFKISGTSEKPKAIGDLSVSFGAGTTALSAGTVTIGANSLAGCKGFYYHRLEGSKFVLSISQPSVINLLPDWNSTAENILSQWKVNDVISIVNNAKYVMCSKITGIDAVNGTITVDTVPFDQIDWELSPNFDDYTIVNVTRPSIGMVSLGLGAMVLGIENQALGSLSQAFGYQNLAAGDFSHVEGRGNKAGYGAHAEGWGNQALGRLSHAEGSDTKSLALAAHAEGSETEAIGSSSHAEGYKTKANGNISHAQGQGTVASGTCSSASGYGVIASGYCSQGQGYLTQALGNNSYTNGDHTIANYDNQFIIGTFNDNKSNTIFEVGIGKQENETDDAGNVIQKYRANGFTVYKDGHAEVGIQGTTDNSLVTLASLKTLSTQVGNKPGVKTNNGEIFNDYTNNIAGWKAHAEGEITKATGSSSHAEGYNTQALGLASHTEGRGTVAGKVQEDGTIAGTTAHAEGNNTKALGYCAHAEGCETIAQHQYSHAGGFYTRTGRDCQTVIGQYNVGKSSNLFEIGYGTAKDDPSRRNIFEVGLSILQGNKEKNGDIAIAKFLNRHICTSQVLGDVSDTDIPLRIVVSYQDPSRASEMGITNTVGMLWIQI